MAKTALYEALSLGGDHQGTTYERLNPSGEMTLLTMVRVVDGPIAANDCVAKRNTETKVILR